MKVHKLLFSALLALLLLASQQIGYAHAVSHFSDSNHPSQQDKQLPADQACDECLVLAQIGSALTSHAYSIFADVTPASVLLPYVTQILVPRTVCVFRSRAPPVLA